MESRFPSQSLPPEGRAPAGFWTQAWLLFHKNFVTKKRQDRKKLFGEIAGPIIYMGLLCVLINLVKIQSYPKQDTPFETPMNVLFPNSSGQRTKYDLSQYTIHVVPETEFSKEFTDTMQGIWNETAGADSTLDFLFYDSEESLIQFYKQNLLNIFRAQGLNLGLILPDINGTDWGQAGEFVYDIRTNPNEMPSPSQRTAPLSTCRDLKEPILGLESSATCPVNNYVFRDFLALQQVVDLAVLRKNMEAESLSAKVKLGVTMENFPKFEFNEGIPTYLRVLIPLYTVLSMAQFVNNLLVLIVTEKEGRIKDGLRMVGITDAAYWVSWLGLYGIIVTFLSVVSTIVVVAGRILSHTNVIIIFLLFFLFGLSVITFSFMLTPFFHKPKTAGLAGTLILQLFSLLFLLQTFLDGVKNALIPLKLISSVAFTTALDEACSYEYSGGIHWADLIPGHRGDTILYSLIFLTFDIGFYAVVAYYLDNVIPNEFGVRKHPLFFLRPGFWKGSTKGEEFVKLVSHEGGSEDRSSIDPGENCEEVGADLKGKEAIKIQNIRKTYTSWNGKTNVEAVKGITLNIYGGQITALLGKNGAGKSTMFNILTGLVSPSSGSAVVFGLDTSRPYDMEKLRKIVGVCLQHDLHFHALTVEEHLEFYGKLRGLDKEELKKEVDTILHELKLNDRRDALAEKLSGGQKRKLSVGIALIGDPKVILLDEPTAGLDPVSRRHLWSLLQQKKKGKVILLTTHFMDEADILADRKAIVHDGVLKCVGSSLYLKNRYGVGYYLTVEMNDRYLDTSASDSIIETWIPEALPSKKVVAHEIKYSLPHSESDKFASVFHEFEEEIAKKDTLNSFGVSMTTLEEVFLKISNDIDLSGDSDGNGESQQEHNLIEDQGKLRPTVWSTFFALFMLRMRRMLRSPTGTFFMLVMPIAFSAGGLALINVKTTNADFLTISPELYPQPDFKIAVNEVGDSFQSYLQELNIANVPYSGGFSELLDIAGEKGSAGALTIANETDNNIINVAMRINGTFLHSPTIILNLITNYLSTTLLSNGSKTTVRNSPFPAKSDFQTLSQSSSYGALLMGPAFISPCIGMIMELVKDKEIKARNHLRVNGVSFLLYFMSFFAFFGVLMIFPVIAQVILIQIFQVPAYTSVYAIVVITGMLLLNVLPSLLFTSILSYLFDKPDSAQSVFSNVVSLSGMFGTLALILLDALVTNRLIVQVVNGIVCALNVFFIPYALFYWVNREYLYATIFSSYTGESVADSISFSTFSTPEIITMLICLLVQIPVFTVLLFVMDVLKDGGNPLHALAVAFNIRKPVAAVHNLENGSIQRETTDEDIVREKHRVSAYFSGAEPNGNCVVAVNNLRKTYRHKGKVRHVLNGVNLMVEKGEVFGLLGHNGAGKTTTMKMITAEESPDYGKIHLSHYDITSNVSDAFRELGFCPQHDALFENITLREHLELYAIIRGIPSSGRKKLTGHFLKGLRIEEHGDKYSEKLSGGTKRKLSYAMSMVGAPKMVLMDEPSTGMDPQSKRFLWNTVLGTFKESRGAVLTTHSMEEADVLCGRIGIMVKGSILCIGSPQHLKNKFGTGYTMEIKLLQQPSGLSHPHVLSEASAFPDSSPGLKKPHSARLNSLPLTSEPLRVPPEFQFVVAKFPSCQLVESFGNRAVFSVPNDGVQSISRTFAVLEDLKGSHNVEEYSFSQTTLEQVFLTFAKDNDENEEH